MFQLTYVSKSKSNLGLTDLNEILEKSNSNNAKLNITGCLIYHNGSFVQILEGDQKDVLEIYDCIQVDKRHTNVTLLWENDAKRFFGEWNMAFYNPKDNDLKEFVENLILYSELTEKSSGSLLSFWATVRKTLSEGKKVNLEKVDFRL